MLQGASEPFKLQILYLRTRKRLELFVEKFAHILF